MSGGGGSYGWPNGMWGPGIGLGSSPVNDYAAENDRGRLALVASLSKNTYSAGKHLQRLYFPTFLIRNTQKCIANEVLW